MTMALLCAVSAPGCTEKSSTSRAGAAASAPGSAASSTAKGSSKGANKPANKRAAVAPANPTPISSSPPPAETKLDGKPLPWQPGHVMRAIALVGFTHDQTAVVLDETYGAKAKGGMRQTLRQVRDLLTWKIVASFCLQPRGGDGADAKVDALLRAAAAQCRDAKAWKAWLASHVIDSKKPPSRGTLSIVADKTTPRLELTQTAWGATYRWTASRRRPSLRVVRGAKKKQVLRFFVPKRVAQLSAGAVVEGKVSVHRAPDRQRLLFMLRASATGVDDARFYIRADDASQAELVCARVEQARCRAIVKRTFGGIARVRLVAASRLPATNVVYYRRDEVAAAQSIAGKLGGPAIVKPLRGKGWLDAIAHVARQRQRRRLEPCLAGTDEVSIKRVWLEGKNVGFCADGSCFRYERAKDRIRAIEAPADKSDSDTGPDEDDQASKKSKDDTRSVKLCVSATSCKSTKQPRSAFSPDKRWVVVSRKKKSLRYHDIYDATTGRKQATADISGECASFEWLGNLLFIEQNVCAGPSGYGFIFDPRSGKKVHPIGGRQYYELYNFTPLSIGGDHYVVTDPFNTEVLVQNLRTGKLLHKVQLDAFSDECCGAKIERYGSGAVAVHASRDAAVSLTFITHEGRLARWRALPRCKKKTK